MNNTLINDMLAVGDDELNHYYLELKKQVESSGYHFNPDVAFT